MRLWANNSKACIFALMLQYRRYIKWLEFDSAVDQTLTEELQVFLEDCEGHSCTPSLTQPETKHLYQLNSLFLAPLHHLDQVYSTASDLYSRNPLWPYIQCRNLLCEIWSISGPRPYQNHMESIVHVPWELLLAYIQYRSPIYKLNSRKLYFMSRTPRICRRQRERA